jgi:predicted CXXCH cytochrome family protein
MRHPKHALCSIVVTLVALAVGSAQAQGIVGSRHDFSSTGWDWDFMHGGSNEICIPCHTPHDSETVVAGALWNHELSTATYSLYSSLTLDATVDQPVGVSKLCLSCHDGSVALDSWGGQTGSVFWGSGHDDVMGTELDDDHPISFIYDENLASNDGQLFDPTTGLSGLGGTIDGDLLFDSRVECASCHDVHDGLGTEYLLRVSDPETGLCRICHDK